MLSDTKRTNMTSQSISISTRATRSIKRTNIAGEARQPVAERNARIGDTDVTVVILLLRKSSSSQRTEKKNVEGTDQNLISKKRR